MDLNNLSKPLTADQVEFRVQSINKGGYATILVYKDARVDMARLNDVCGPLGWERIHTNGNHNCIVRVFDSKHGHWVAKEDTGTESNTQKEKGLASDSFKRACFNWGIGIELYDYPLISIKLDKGEWDLNGGRPKQTYNLKLKDWRWLTQFDDNKKLTFIAAKDQGGKMRYQWGEYREESK